MSRAAWISVVLGGIHVLAREQTLPPEGDLDEEFVHRGHEAGIRFEEQHGEPREALQPSPNPRPATYALLAALFKLAPGRRFAGPRPGRCFDPDMFHDTARSMKHARKAPPRSEKTLPTRLQRHRAQMRRRGFKLVQLWVPDPKAPRFRDAVRRTRQFLEEHPDREWDAYARRILDEAPDWNDA